MKLPIGVIALVALTASFAGTLASSQSMRKTDPSVSACTDIDFLAGSWEVRRSDGTIDATAIVTLSKEHCHATESWNLRPAMGGGQSVCLIAYSAQMHNWANLCSAGFGERYRFADGKLIGSELRFTGEDVMDGVTQSASYFHLPGQRVHELVKESKDGGKTWTTLADEYWSRKP